MVIKLIDGPLAGDLHEVAGTFPTPDRFGLVSGPLLHWYITDHKTETATYDTSEDRIERKKRKDNEF